MANISDITFAPLRSLGIDRTGTKHGTWTVLGYAGDLRWWAECSCGFIGKIGTKGIKKGRSLSCLACRPQSKNAKLNEGKRLAGIWNHMQQRCYNPKSKSFEHYGARGIKICAEWKSDFFAFAKWAKGNGYSDALTIERKDNDQGYCPDNCTWIPNVDQAKNRRSLVMLGDGPDRTYRTAYAIAQNVEADMLRCRLRSGWGLQDATFLPKATIRKRDASGRYDNEVIKGLPPDHLR